MNALAKELNEIIAKDNPAVLEMLSDLGKNLFMPKGIITQSAEAKEKAHKYNVTIGIATDKNGPMFLDSVYQCFTDMEPKDIFHTHHHQVSLNCVKYGKKKSKRIHLL